MMTAGFLLALSINIQKLASAGNRLEIGPRCLICLTLDEEKPPDFLAIVVGLESALHP
jgi:hypothetical protein